MADLTVADRLIMSVKCGLSRDRIECYAYPPMENQAIAPAVRAVVMPPTIH